MANYYFTLPDAVTLPTDGNKISLTTACELHRDDSAVPNALPVANGTYNVFLASDPTSATAAAATGLARTAATAVVNDSTSGVAAYDSVTHGPGTITAASGSNRLLLLLVAHGSSSTTPPQTVTASFGAQAFTSVNNRGNWYTNSQIFYIKEADIPAGAQTITITPAVNGNSCFAYLLEYSGVDQTTPIGGTGTDTGGAFLGISVTVGAASSFLTTLAVGRAAGIAYTASANAGTILTTDRTDVDNNSDIIWGVMENQTPDTGAQELTVTPNVTNNNAACTVEIREAP